MPIACPTYDEWNAPRAPFKGFGNTYFVGTQGLSSVLITTEQGLVLIDVARDSRVVSEALLRQGVIVRSGYARLPTPVRVTVGTDEQNRRFVRALEKCL